MKKITTKFIKEQKGVNKLVMITAYDALFANIFDEKVDMILVGDSLEMSFNGRNDTLKASMDGMIYHTNAVCNGAKRALIIADMPFGSVINKDEALKNSLRVYKETKADAVKVECNSANIDIIKYLVDNQIAVVAHIGLTPQSSRSEGGYLIKGRSEAEKIELLSIAKKAENSGAFCIVVEGVISEVAKLITNSVNIPVIGIGAGASTDGQVLVWSDAFGFFDEFKPKFVRRFLNGKELILKALDEYVSEVKSGNFPSQNESYTK